MSAIKATLRREILDDFVLASILGKVEGLEAKQLGLLVSERKDSAILRLMQCDAWDTYKCAKSLSAREAKSLDPQRDTGGGYLMPAEKLAEFQDVPLADFNNVEKYAMNISLTTGDCLIIPAAVARTVSVVRRSTDLHTPTGDIVFKGDKIFIHDFNNVQTASFALTQDAVSVDKMINGPQYSSLRVTVSQKLINGTGEGEPEGLLTSGGVNAVKSGNASALTGDGVVALHGGIAGVYQQNGTWLMNSKTEVLVRQLKDSSGNYLYRDGTYGIAPSTILGRPVEICPAMPDVASGSTPIIFGDLSWYWVVTRTEFALFVDPYSHKPNVDYDAVRRVGAQLINPAAVAKQVVSA